MRFKVDVPGPNIGLHPMRLITIRKFLCCFIFAWLLSSGASVWAQNQTENETFVEPDVRITLAEIIQQPDQSEDDEKFGQIKNETIIKEDLDFNSEKGDKVNGSSKATGIIYDNANSSKDLDVKNLQRIVNKCCGLNQRYESRTCVDVDDGSYIPTRMVQMMENSAGPLWKQEFETASDLNISLFPKYSVEFKLKISMPDCAESEMTENIIFMDANSSQSHKQSMYGTLESSSLILSKLGYLIFQDVSGFMNTLPYNDFCMDQINETAFVALLCRPACSAKKPCIRKCCGPDSVLDIKSGSCIVSKNQWSPHLYDATPALVEPSLNLHYTYGLPNCTPVYPISARNDPTEKMYTLVNGSLLTISEGERFMFSPDKYCIDRIAKGELDLVTTNSFEPPILVRWDELDQVAIVCYPSENNDANPDVPPWVFTVYAIGAFTSAFFLTLTAIVYLILWENQNIHGWLQFIYVVSYLQSYLLLGILQLASNAIHEYDSNLCEAMGSVIHFSFLSAFFWMTSMNFDLWLTFSGCRPLRTRSKAGEIKRFCFFALFSWGPAGLIAGTGLILDCWYKDDPSSTVIRPRFGDKKCYFYGPAEQLHYFYGPIGCLLLIDLIFFLHTVYSLHKLQQDTRFATQQSSRQEKKKFILFVKLFIVMGVLWVFEVISFALKSYTSWARDSDKVFFTFDVINAYQGLLIFIIFTCKPNTCRQLESQFKKFTLFLEEKRDKGVGISALNKAKGWLLIAGVTLMLPTIHLLRKIFSMCGRRSRSMTGRHHTSHTTTMTSTFGKSRKTSDTSTTTSMSFKDPGAYELDIRSFHI